MKCTWKVILCSLGFIEASLAGNPFFETGSFNFGPETHNYSIIALLLIYVEITAPFVKAILLMFLRGPSGPLELK